MKYYIDVLMQYAVFTGRASRKEYWMFTLFNTMAYIALAVLGFLVHFPFLHLIYSLGVMVPGVAVSVRRMHDIGRNGWWILLSIIPLIGPIIFLIMCLKDSQPGDNIYGPNPKNLNTTQG